MYAYKTIFLLESYDSVQFMPKMWLNAPFLFLPHCGGVEKCQAFFEWRRKISDI